MHERGSNIQHSLLIDKNGMEHKTAKKKADSLGKYFSNKFSLGSNGLQLPDLPDLQALTHPILSNVHFRAPFCSATSVQGFSIQGHWPRRYPCYGPASAVSGLFSFLIISDKVVKAGWMRARRLSSKRWGRTCLKRYCALASNIPASAPPDRLMP